jgi:RNA polymerase sigma factor (TIGR02999 family)
MTEVTRILNQIENGSSESASKLLPLVYNELRKMAAAKMARENPGQTLDATGLVHEAFLRLVGNQTFESRRHFFGAAAESMRRILIDRARARKSEKRGGAAERAEIDVDRIVPSTVSDDRLTALNEALSHFEKLEPEKAELVKLRYFVGLKIHEAAEVLGISTATADRYWAYARAWLQSDLSED